MMRSQERISVVLRRTGTAASDSDSGNSHADNRATLAAALSFANDKPVHLSAVGVFATDDDDTICQEALDLGFDAAVSITAPVPIDFFGEALLLRAAIDSMRSTMVICGDYDGNFEGASMGAALAFMLDIPCMTGVLDCKFKGDDYLIKRRTDIGVDHIRCPRPALLTFMDRNKDAVPIDSKKKASAAVESRPASTLLEDLSVLYSRSPLAVHAAFAARPEATELVSDPKALLTCLREANLWDSK